MKECDFEDILFLAVRGLFPGFLNIQSNKTMRTRLEIITAGFCAIAALAISGCNPQNDSMSNEGSTNGMTESASTQMQAGDASSLKAICTLSPTQGHEAMGSITFTQTGDGVRVVADITGLKPGEHGIHVHEKGDCSAPDGSSAGGHFNPTGMPHGGPDSAQHHIGDLGNITADASGKAHLDRVFSFLTMSGTNSIIGHAIIVHEGRDDLTSQPSGNAGARVACGVIQVEK